MKKLVFVLGVMWSAVAHGQNLAWAKSFGASTTFDDGNAIFVDAAGYIYATGKFQGAFVTKMDNCGNIVWNIKFTSNGGANSGQSIAVDAAGNIYVMGEFYGTVDFDPNYFSSFTLTGGNGSIFLVKLTASGNLIWAKKIQGKMTENSQCLALGNSGDVYITGYFENTIDLDPGPGTQYVTAGLFRHIFITKLDSSGNFIWGKQIGGGGQLCQSIVIDDSGNLYASGYFSDWTTDFDPGPGTLNLSTSLADIFILKLDVSGNLIWVKQLGTGWGYGGNSVALDGMGNLYATGRYIVSTRDQDIFITKLDTSGNLTWLKRFGSVPSPIGGAVQEEGGNSIAINGDRIYVTGTFERTADFDPGTGTFNVTSAGEYDIFIAQFDTSGGLFWAGQFGGTSDDVGYSLAVDAAGAVYATGDFRTLNADFDPCPDTFILSGSGNTDVFILKLGDTASTASISGALLTEWGIPVQGVTVTLSGDDSLIYITDTIGRYNFTVAQCGSYTITPSKSNDVVANNGISAVDILLMRRHILGNGALGSPYKIIAAAEANAAGDTQVSTADILLTRQLILGTATSFPTNRLWQFVSSDYVFPDVTNPFPFPTTRTYTNITTNQTGQDFIGIKLGDVNGSWDAGTP